MQLVVHKSVRKLHVTSCKIMSRLNISKVFNARLSTLSQHPPYSSAIRLFLILVISDITCFLNCFQLSRVVSFFFGQLTALWPCTWHLLHLPLKVPSAVTSSCLLSSSLPDILQVTYISLQSSLAVAFLPCVVLYIKFVEQMTRLYSSPSIICTFNIPFRFSKWLLWTLVNFRVFPFSKWLLWTWFNFVVTFRFMIPFFKTTFMNSLVQFQSLSCFKMTIINLVQLCSHFQIRFLDSVKIPFVSMQPLWTQFNFKVPFSFKTTFVNLV